VPLTFLKNHVTAYNLLTTRFQIVVADADFSSFVSRERERTNPQVDYGDLLIMQQSAIRDSINNSRRNKMAHYS
jgi:hypothetical protein